MTRNMQGALRPSRNGACQMYGWWEILIGQLRMPLEYHKVRFEVNLLRICGKSLLNSKKNTKLLMPLKDCS